MDKSGKLVIADFCCCCTFSGRLLRLFFSLVLSFQLNYRFKVQLCYVRFDWFDPISLGLDLGSRFIKRLSLKKITWSCEQLDLSVIKWIFFQIYSFICCLLYNKDKEKVIFGQSYFVFDARSLALVGRFCLENLVGHFSFLVFSCFVCFVWFGLFRVCTIDYRLQHTYRYL